MRRADLAVSAISALCLALSFDIALADASASVGQPVPIAVVDFNYIDTSGEPQDQSAAHQKRLHALMLALRSELAEKGDYRLVPIECRPGPCSVARSDSPDLLAAVREAGARILLNRAGDPPALPGRQQ